MPRTMKAPTWMSYECRRYFVDEGMTMKRMRPRAKGRADRILKRTVTLL